MPEQLTDPSLPSGAEVVEEPPPTRADYFAAKAEILMDQSHHLAQELEAAQRSGDQERIAQLKTARQEWTNLFRFIKLSEVRENEPGAREAEYYQLLGQLTDEQLKALNEEDPIYGLYIAARGKS